MCGSSRLFRRRSLQLLFAIDERYSPKIKPVAVNQIEREIDRTGLCLMLQHLLQGLKIASALFVQHHDFAVEDCGATFNRPNDPGDSGNFFVQSFPFRVINCTFRLSPGSECDIHRI